MPYDWYKPYDSGVAYDAGNPQFITLSGIGSLESFSNPVPAAVWDDLSVTWDSPSAVWDSLVSGSSGLVVTNTGAANVTLTGLPSPLAFGIPSINNPTGILLSGIGTSEVFGTQKINAPALIRPNGISSAEAFGTITIPSTATGHLEMARVL